MEKVPRIPLPINWPLLPIPDEFGRMSYRSLETSVAEFIRVVLATRPGEQLMRSEFGAGLDEFMHAPNTPGTRRQLQVRIIRSLAQWEDRILVDRVEVAEVSDRPTHLRVEILYRLRRTGASRRLGLTLHLE
jgi:uncharacterized protein